MKMRNEKGFTLVELLVVMAILGILVLIAAPRMFSMTEGARKRTLESNHRMLVSGVNMYIADYNGKVPSTMAEVMQFVQSTNADVTDSLDGSPSGSVYTMLGTGTAKVILSKLTLDDGSIFSVRYKLK